MPELPSAYSLAKKSYSAIGVDTDAAMSALKNIPVSIHCWQGDDVGGFENPNAALTGGIQVTGAYPGKANTPEELRRDIGRAMSMVPGTLKLNLHAMYLEKEPGDAADRDAIEPRHFENWVRWAKGRGIGLDFNPTFFAHPKSEPFTLSSPDETVRKFWINHGKACREIGAYFGKETGITCVTNIWIPDGFKDTPVDRYAYRRRLKDSLDQILEKKLNPAHNLDAVESKLFGIGSESCVIGSHEFYMGYAAANDILLTLDTGHFHPMEFVSDKISSVLCFLDKILLHVSRPVRWDSDHVVTFTDELKEIALEIVRNGFMDKVKIGLDFFDGSINRIAAWVIGARNMSKALLYALLEPTETLKKAEADGDYTTRLALLEEMKTMPFGAVWDEFCRAEGVPAGVEWMREIDL